VLEVSRRGSIRRRLRAMRPSGATALSKPPPNSRAANLRRDDLPVIIRPSGVLGSSSPSHGRMAFVGNDLIAILVEVEGQNAEAPRWSIDWMADGVDGRPPMFTQLEAARLWLSHRYRFCRGRISGGSR